jgi:hypothetical protein
MSEALSWEEMRKRRLWRDALTLVAWGRSTLRPHSPDDTGMSNDPSVTATEL